MRRDGRIYSDDGRPFRPARRTLGHHNRRYLLQNTPHGVKPRAKKGIWAPNRKDEGRHVHQTSRRGRCQAPPYDLLHHGRPDQRYTGATALLDDLPKAHWLLAGRGYDAVLFRDTLEQKGIKPCIPGRKFVPILSRTTNGNTSGPTKSRSCWAA